ncbi:polysaccharide deacetylase family protein [Blastococcus sp. TF02A-30]|uniref:polysaccharide deacetylase family protein n=1 Tax=Blastococcus sp. TF02A-30 TaxID=2250580 RepID=UPI0018F54D07|nr:polysaccharide deacetylase family protein [Blastococcus sp. TF02A-30]
MGRRARLAITAAAVAVVGAVVAVVVTVGGGDDGSPGASGDGSPASSPSATSTATTPTEGPPGHTPTPSPTTPAPGPTTTPAPSPTAPVPGPTVPAALRGQDVTAIPTDRRVVALTFDAGGDSSGLAPILRTLAEQRVPATFFVTGRWAAADPAGLAAIRAAGHRIGNHSVSHPHFPALSDAALAEEVRGVERTLRGSGIDPRPLFRFPFGDRDARTIGAVNDLGYVAVRWTVDTLGWQGTSGGRSVQSVVDRVLGAQRPGEIVLMHVGAHPEDRSTLDADALPAVIAGLRSAGYGFVTLDALTPL